MNGKKARKLRRLARQMSPGLDDVVNYASLDHKKPVTLKNKYGDTKQVVAVRHQVVVVDCHRTTYQQLKRMVA